MRIFTHTAKMHEMLSPVLLCSTCQVAQREQRLIHVGFPWAQCVWQIQEVWLALSCTLPAYLSGVAYAAHAGAQDHGVIKDIAIIA